MSTQIDNKTAAREAAAAATASITKDIVKAKSLAGAVALNLRAANKVGNEDYAAILAGCLVALAPAGCLPDPVLFRATFARVWAGFPKSPSAALQEWLKDETAPKASPMATKYQDLTF